VWWVCRAYLGHVEYGSPHFQETGLRAKFKIVVSGGGAAGGGLIIIIIISSSSSSSNGSGSSSHNNADLKKTTGH
jgi:hypothetical protein